MKTSRVAGAVAAVALTAPALAGCGGSDTEPLIRPTSGSPSSAAPVDADGFTPEQREIADQVAAYFTAVTGRGSSPVDPRIKDLATPALFDLVTASEKKNVDDKDLQYLGDVKIDVTKVTVDGDSATVEGCNDGSGVFVVKKGATDVSGPSQLLGYSTMDVALVRQDGRWLVDSPQLEAVTSC